jgi:hypothetical protein
MPPRCNDWHVLDAATTWLSHAAVIDPPPGDESSRPVWTALTENRFDRAMALAQGAFEAGGGGDLCEAMGLLCRITGREDLTADFFALAPPPGPRAWRNRGVAALWARRWPEAAAAFSTGAGNDADADALWCHEAYGLMATVARRWDLASAILGEPTQPPHADGLGPLAHLCRMAAAFGLRGLKAGMGPDLRPAVLDDPESAAPPPNAGSGRPERGLSGDLVLFLACDPGYLDRYGLAALASFAQAHRGQRVGAHLHLYDSDEAARGLARRAAETLGLPLALTAEATPAETDPARRGTYYACARFCRLAEAAASHAAPILALDADAIVRRDLFPLLGRVPHVGLACSPLTVPWNRHPAGFLLLNRSGRAARFLADAALLIGDSLGRGRRLWFLDQWALLLAATRHPRSLRRLPWRCVYDTEFGRDSRVWQANDRRKSGSRIYLAEADRLRRDALGSGLIISAELH